MESNEEKTPAHSGRGNHADEANNSNYRGDFEGNVAGATEKKDCEGCSLTRRWIVTEYSWRMLGDPCLSSVLTRGAKHRLMFINGGC